MRQTTSSYQIRNSQTQHVQYENQNFAPETHRRGDVHRSPPSAQHTRPAAKMAADRQRLTTNDDGSVTMVIGYEAWPFPIPLVKTDAGWQFDTDAGAEEVLKRRIGENELTALSSLRAYVNAQRQYAAVPGRCRR